MDAYDVHAVFVRDEGLSSDELRTILHFVGVGSWGSTEGTDVTVRVVGRSAAKDLVWLLAAHPAVESVSVC
jgi:hypothetical protein